MSSPTQQTRQRRKMKKARRGAPRKKSILKNGTTPPSLTLIVSGDNS